MEEISRGDFKQGEVYMAIKPQLKNPTQGMSTSLSSPLNHTSLPQTRAVGSSVPARGTGWDEWGEIHGKLRKRRMLKIASSSSAGQTGKGNCAQKADLENWVVNVWSHWGLGLQTDFLMTEAMRH